MRPLLGTQKSYIRNSTEYANWLRNFTLKENSTLSSFDVVFMYSNCNVKKCKDILRIKLQKHFDLIKDLFMVSLETEVIMKLVILANEHSLYFGFKGEFHKQVFGLAMWASLSTLLSNLFMESIETSAIHSFWLSPCFWRRFMDDVVCIWKHGLESLDLFHKHLKSFEKTQILQWSLKKVLNYLFWIFYWSKVSSIYFFQFTESLPTVILWTFTLATLSQWNEVLWLHWWIELSELVPGSFWFWIVIFDECFIL